MTSMSLSLFKPDCQLHLPGFLHQQVPTFLLLSHTPIPFQFRHLRSHQCLHHPTSILPVSLPHPPTFPPPSQPYSHSISISLSPLSLMPSSPNFYSPGLPTTSLDDDDAFSWTPISPLASPSSTPNSPLDAYDLLWAMECDHVPEHNGSWPSGMYARDMAWAFTHLQGTCVDVEIHFRQVFPNAAWVKATYYRHKDAFYGSMSSEIKKCQSLP